MLVNTIGKAENKKIIMLPGSFFGLDFSMHGLYMDSSGYEPCYPGYYRQAEKKLKREQRKLSLM